MKIAYIAGFTGPEFVNKFCNSKELHYAATQKILSLSRAIMLAGHEVIVISSGVTGIGATTTGFTELIKFPEGIIKVIYPNIITYRGGRVVNNLRVKKLFEKQIDKIGLDALMIYNASERSSMMLKVAKKHKMLTVLEYEDHYLSHFRNSIFSPRAIFLKRAAKFIFKNVDLIISVSPFLLGDKNIRKANLILPGILDDEIIQLAGKKHDLPQSDSAISIVYAGGLTHAKGPDIAINALNYLDIPVELHIVGDGPLRESLEKLACQVPAIHKIKIHGFVTREQMLNHIFRANILINPHRLQTKDSLTGKLFPFKMIEYAATGNPIVSSKMGKLNDDFNNKITYYDGESQQSLAVAIKNIVNNITDCKKKSMELSRMVIREYSIMGVSEKLKEIFS